MDAPGSCPRHVGWFIPKRRFLTSKPSAHGSLNQVRDGLPGEDCSQCVRQSGGLRYQPCLHAVRQHPGVRELPCDGGYRALYRVAHDTGDNATAGDVLVLRVFGPGQDRGRL